MADGSLLKYSIEDNVACLSVDEGVESIKVCSAGDHLAFIFLSAQVSLGWKDNSVKIKGLGEETKGVEQVLQLWKQVLDSVADIADQEPKNKEAVLNLADLWLKYNRLQKPLAEVYQLHTAAKLSAEDVKNRLAFLKANTVEKVPLIDLINDSLPT